MVFLMRIIKLIQKLLLPFFDRCRRFSERILNLVQTQPTLILEFTREEQAMDKKFDMVNDKLLQIMTILMLKQLICQKDLNNMYHKLIFHQQYLIQNEQGLLKIQDQFEKLFYLPSKEMPLIQDQMFRPLEKLQISYPYKMKTNESKQQGYF
ncbi:unnamed protein product [Paramecium octaurelia]|uniref:Uncharacterized protein n=1 Tax=Paramecium octaurelia TaxID=43137 RepID=A0A8S1Y4U5_PAROT|nr:unnamed protein product [Paramecium octaurelia]